MVLGSVSAVLAVIIGLGTVYAVKKGRIEYNDTNKKRAACCIFLCLLFTAIFLGSSSSEASVAMGYLCAVLAVVIGLGTVYAVKKGRIEYNDTTKGVGACCVFLCLLFTAIFLGSSSSAASVAMGYLCAIMSVVIGLGTVYAVKKDRIEYNDTTTTKRVGLCCIFLCLVLTTIFLSVGLNPPNADAGIVNLGGNESRDANLTGTLLNLTGTLLNLTGTLNNTDAGGDSIVSASADAALVALGSLSAILSVVIGLSSAYAIKARPYDNRDAIKCGGSCCVFLWLLLTGIFLGVGLNPPSGEAGKPADESTSIFGNFTNESTGRRLSVVLGNATNATNETMVALDGDLAYTDGRPMSGMTKAVERGAAGYVPGSRCNAGISTGTPADYTTCDVVKIDLVGNNMSGTLPARICSLSGLHSIDLSNNSLSGELPECGPLDLPNLQELILNSEDPSNVKPFLDSSIGTMAVITNGTLESVTVNRFVGTFPQPWLLQAIRRRTLPLRALHVAHTSFTLPNVATQRYLAQKCSSELECSGLPPLSCSAFGPGRHVVDVKGLECIECADPWVVWVIASLLFLTFMIVLVTALRCFKKYVSGRILRHSSTVIILMNQLQTVALSTPSPPAIVSSARDHGACVCRARPALPARATVCVSSLARSRLDAPQVAAAAAAALLSLPVRLSQAPILAC